MAGRARPSALDRDAEALYDAATAFIRLYQFRDRDQALKFELTVVQAYTLDILLATDGGAGQSLTALAERLQLDKSTMSRIISGMERHGLVDWSRPEHDLRAKRIVASAEGKRRYERLRSAIVRDNARLLASYTPAARRAVLGVLRELTQRAGGGAARRR
jgi:DNA-binding MarR family transcriptional regulator